MISHCRRSLLRAVAAYALWMPAAQAQEAARQDAEQPSDQTTADGSVISDIVVTAQRREQRLQDTPIAITALGRESIEDRQITNVEALTANTPGLFIAQVSASPNALLVSLRGAIEQNGGTITSESPVAIYIDDVYQSRLSAANYDLADIERVEVLRGPQGTLYGRNSMTGAVKLITRQPTGKTWLNTDVSLGSYDEVRAKASIGAPLGDRLAIAASGFYANRGDGWQYNDTLGTDVGKFTKYGAQLSLGVVGVPNLEAVLTGRYAASLTDGQHFVPLDYATNASASSGFYTTSSPVDANGDTRQTSVALKLGYDFGGATLRSITAYQDLKDDWALDFSGGYRVPGVGIVPGFFRSSAGKQHQFTQEFQLLGKAFDDRLNWIVGAFYFDERGEQVFGNDNLAAFFLSFLPTSFVNRSRSTAGYAQADYKLTDRLTASLGVRYTADRKRFSGMQQNAIVANPTLATVARATDANVVTPRANLQYDFTPDAMAYVTVARGYRAGGFNSLVLADPLNFGVPYRPEYVWSYEVGSKLDLFSRRVRLNGAAYLEELSDLQTLATIPGGNGSFVTQNAAASKVWGVELEAAVVPTDGLSLFGNLTYMDSKYTRLDPGSQAAISGATDLPLISKWQYQVGATYDLSLGGGGGVAFATDWSYRSTYRTAVTPSIYQETKLTGRLNASVTYRHADHLEVYVAARNLNNSKDYYSALEFIPGVFAYKAPLEPRTWQAGFRYRY